MMEVIHERKLGLLFQELTSSDGVGGMEVMVFQGLLPLGRSKGF